MADVAEDELENWVNAQDDPERALAAVNRLIELTNAFTQREEGDKRWAHKRIETFEAEPEPMTIDGLEKLCADLADRLA